MHGRRQQVRALRCVCAVSGLEEPCSQLDARLLRMMHRQHCDRESPLELGNLRRAPLVEVEAAKEGESEQQQGSNRHQYPSTHGAPQSEQPRMGVARSRPRGLLPKVRK